MTATQPAAEPVLPVLRVVRGEPTDEELAALVVALAAGTSAGTSAGPGPSATAAGSRGAGWVARAAGLRRPLPHGPGSWRASAFPLR